MTRTLLIALSLAAFTAGVRAQTGDGSVAGGGARIEERAPGVSPSGDVAGAGAKVNDRSNLGDRRTLDDLKAGTSGSTQVR